MTAQMAGHWSDQLVTLRACSEAVVWARTQPDLAAAWASCERGDWLLWLAGRICQPNSAAHRQVVRAAVGCARLALPLFTAAYPDDPRPRQALDAAEAWALGTGTQAAASAAASAASAAWAAAWAAASAASAAASAAWAAASDASAARAAWAAWAAASDASADIVRGLIPTLASDGFDPTWEGRR
jgi:hypothetical protein